MSTQLPRLAGQETPLDAVFHILSDESRRAVLSVLQGEEAPMHMADLAREIASLTDDQGDPERLYLSLHHVHLPMLTDAGLVAVDHDRNTVELVGEIPTVVVDGVTVTSGT